ncbi:MAG: hypothetical protein ACYS47_00330 [Planctomycetota bacterium]
MIRKLLILLASPALLITPVLTVCHHGDDGHLELLGHCHAEAPSAAIVEKGCGCDHGSHQHVHAGGDSVSPESVSTPHFAHAKLRTTDLASFVSRFGTVPLETGAVDATTVEVPHDSENPRTESREREPPRAPPLILLTRSLLL